MVELGALRSARLVVTGAFDATVELQSRGQVERVDGRQVVAWQAVARISGPGFLALPAEAAAVRVVVTHCNGVSPIAKIVGLPAPVDTQAAQERRHEGEKPCQDASSS